MAFLEAARQIAIVTLFASAPSAEATSVTYPAPIERPAVPHDAVLPENTIFTIQNDQTDESPQPRSPINFNPILESTHYDRIQWNGRATLNSDAQINSRKPSTFGRNLQH